MIVYLARDIPQFVMYCVNGKPRSSLFIESTDSMIIKMNDEYKINIILYIFINIIIQCTQRKGVLHLGSTV